MLWVFTRLATRIGFEPTIFGLTGQYVNRYTTGPFIFQGTSQALGNLSVCSYEKGVKRGHPCAGVTDDWPDCYGQTNGWIKILLQTPLQGTAQTINRHLLQLLT